jgi:outer membrane protein assembly factor BamB
MGRGRAPLVGLWLMAGLALSGTGTAQELSIASASVAEGDAGNVTLDFVVTLSPASGQDVTVEWRTQSGTASAGDFVAVTGALLTFPAGTTTRLAQVTVKGDLMTEPVETLAVELLNPAPAIPLTVWSAVGTIFDNDPEPLISIGDRQVIEGNSGDVAAVFLVTLTNPSAATVTASWATNGGNATAGTDYTPGSGSVVFPPGSMQQSITVYVRGDLIQESDETFQVTLSSATNGTPQKDVGVGVILNDDGGVTYPGVQALALVADGPSGGRIRLQWVAPSPVGTPTSIRILWNQASTTCSHPTDPEGPSSGVHNLPWQGSGSVQSDVLTGLTLGDQFCFSVWVVYSGPAYSTEERIAGRPFNSTGRVKFKYVTKATAVTAPTIGTDGVLVPSNDNRVHALSRGATGGDWPAGWKPPNLGSPVQSRSPIVPIGGMSWAYFATDDGWVHAIDAKTGAPQWQTQLTPAAGLAAPAGIFKAFGGTYDYLLVGTSSGGPNRFYALDPFTGAVIDYYPRGGDPGADLGRVSGMAVVDYATNRVYFGAIGGTSGKTLICLELGPASDGLRPTGPAVDRAVVGDIEGSPVLRNGRLYVGNLSGVLWSMNAADLGDRYSTSLGTGRVKAFPWPDRTSDWLYAMVENGGTGLLQGVRDTGTLLSVEWTSPVPQGSPVLMRPGTRLLYVGSSDLGAGAGGVFQVNADNGAPVGQVLEPAVLEFGAPSLDGANGLLYVGSVTGTIYGVDVSTPWP